MGAKGDLLIVDAQDPAMLDELHELILGFNQTTAEAAAKDYQGVKVFSLGPTKPIAWSTAGYWSPSHGEVLRRAWIWPVQIRRQQPGQHPLVHLRPQGSRPPRHAGRRQPGHGGEVAQGQRPLEEYRGNPLSALVLAGLIDAAKHSDWLALGLQTGHDGLWLRAVTSGQPDAAGLLGFSVPTGPQGTLANLAYRGSCSASASIATCAGLCHQGQVLSRADLGLIFFET